MKITIFTPTYNRAYNLKNVYDSICNQTYKNFEWVVVDDGSVDNTKQVIESFKHEEKIHINYHYQENRGKHFAINKGVALAEGELFLILDSDDELPDFALQLIADKYKGFEGKEDIGGVAGRRMFKGGDIVGSNNFTELISNSLDIRYKHHVSGDLVEIFKTDVLKEFTFPEIEDEKFCPEALLWNRIAQKYKLLFFNKGIYITQYLPDGLTSKIVKIRMTSPVASMLTYSELQSYEVPFVQKIKGNINFWRFSFNSNYSFLKRLKMVSLILSFVGLPLGFVLYLKDKKNN